eukprot:CAMPEP_0197591858 /NCGR_PEP_ID=MMETSP1326-20131121/13953_1 /TAXON_ID=1155430 /ORGANISM="Genus nov. species nov., Strain RCC2288" /LENGTH=271 /DNA_ID=CAMNT_0043157427 /DNA_START=47 /DNA_END=862 /DNA_ORIENTATION=-
MSAVAFSTAAAAAVCAPRAAIAAKQTRRCAVVVRAAASPSDAAAAAVSADKAAAMPVVKIDNMSDPLATIIDISFGDCLGSLMDTCAALTKLGLNINRAEVNAGDNPNRFYVTDTKTSEKVVKSEQIEDIRMTIIQNMLKYHPEAGAFLVEGKTPVNIPGNKEADANPLGARFMPVVKTKINIESSKGGSRSIITVETTDRAGLLVDIVRTLKDVNLNVISAEIDTIGPKAFDIIYCTYQGKALNKSMEQLVTNALTYYLSVREVATDESY